MSINKLPLEGLRVVELSSVVATPITARLLSDYGAEVIKVEGPSGDLLRPMGIWHTLPATDTNNPLFDFCNAGKKLVELNLKTEDGMSDFQALLGQADIFLTNIRMQSLERMQLDYDSLRDKYPRLIYAHFSGFGLGGEERNRPGYDTTCFWMRTGASVDMSLPGSFPLRPSFAFGDIATASEFLAAILMAVIGRAGSGTGTMVTTSLLQSGIWCNAVSVMNSQPQYGKQYPVERYSPGHPFSDYYQCGDGEYISVNQNNYETDRARYSALFNYPELMTDPRLETLQTLRETGMVPEVTRRMQEIMLQKTSAEWDAIFAENDIPHEVAHHFQDVCLDRQAAALNAFDKVEYPGGVVTSIPRPPFEFSAYGRKPFEKAGAVGRDNAAIFGEAKEPAQS